MRNRMIYLAAGNSVRFGENKLLFPIAGKPMYQHGLFLLFSILEKKEEYELIVATQYPQIYEEVSQLKLQRENIADRIYPLLTKQSRLGMSYTIREAIEYGWTIPEKTDFSNCISGNERKIWQEGPNYDTFMVADQPYMTEVSLLGFMEGMTNSGRLVGCVTEKDQYGNPVMFRSSLEEELLQMEGDQGGKRIFRRHLDSSYTYPVENECQDIDTLSSLG